MSSRAVWNVWRHSQHKGAELLVLLKLAEFADPSGKGTLPPFTELATAARISLPELEDLLRGIARSGEFFGEGQPGTPYQIALPERQVGSEMLAATG